MNEPHNPAVGPTGFDKESIYDSEIMPLMDKIIEICKRHEMPMFASFCYRKSDDEGDGETSMCTTHLPGPNGEFHMDYATCLVTVQGNTRAAAFTIRTT